LKRYVETCSTIDTRELLECVLVTVEETLRSLYENKSGADRLTNNVKCPLDFPIKMGTFDANRLRT
jgi:hypothetical protein